MDHKATNHKLRTKLPKTKTHPITYQEKLIKIQNKFPDHYHIYTDGSKQGKNVGCAAISQKKETLKRLPNEVSIYSAETTAIDLAMNHKASKFIIYTDSKSVLLALQNRDTSSPLITKLLKKLNTLSKNNNIIFTWIPSHIGIQGNEKADKAAKKALQIDMCKSKIPYTDLKPTIKKFISDKWQKSLDNQTQNKRHEIQEAIGEWPTGHRSIRREEVILARLRIGHTHITHSHLLKREDAP